MAITTTQNMPPPFITHLGEDFTDYFKGTTPITDSPFNVDTSTFTGDQFVAGQDALTSQAQGLSGGLGGYQQYLDDAQGFQTGAADFFGANRDVADPL